MSESTTLSLRIDNETLARIDQAAEQAGETRSTYLLSWCPEYHGPRGERRGRRAQNAAHEPVEDSR